MIRAAAKNHADVAVVVDPADYAGVLAELKQHGATTLALRQRLAAKAYARTAAYDAAIANWFADQLKDPAPAFRTFGGRLVEALRYGENPAPERRVLPHAGTALRRRHRPPGAGQAALLQQHQRHRRGLRVRRRVRSGAHRCGRRSSSMPIRAASPRARTWSRAYRKALRCDPVSALRRHRRGEPHARRRRRRAPSPRSSPTSSSRRTRAEDAIAIVGAKKNLRLLLAGGLPDARAPRPDGEARSRAGCWCSRATTPMVDEMQLQDRDQARRRRASELDDLRFAFRVRQARQVEHDRLRQGSAPPSASAPDR